MAPMCTKIEFGDGFIVISCGELRVIVPASLDHGEDERAEIQCNGSRVFVESHDDGPLVSAIERFTEGGA